MRDRAPPQEALGKRRVIRSAECLIMAMAPTCPSRRTRNTMTSKLTRQTTDAGKLGKFPDFPPRDDMQNSLHLDQPAYQASLQLHFGNNDSTIVLSRDPRAMDPGANGRTPHSGPARCLRRGPGAGGRADGLLRPTPGQAAGLRAGSGISHHGTEGLHRETGTTTPPSASPSTGG